MPIISKSQVRFGDRYFQKVIKCDARGIFTCELPPETHHTLDKKLVSAGSLEELEKEWTAALAKFKEAQSVVTKVIMFCVGVSAYIEDHTTREVRINEARVGHGSLAGMAVNLWANVYEETKTQVDAKSAPQFVFKELESTLPISVRHREISHEWYRNSMSHRSNHQYVIHKMDWTPEREDMLRRLAHGMENLIVQLTNFANAPDIIALVDKLATQGWNFGVPAISDSAS